MQESITIQPLRSNYPLKINIPASIKGLATDRTGSIFKAYWIRTEDHTDPSKEGYVGITGGSIRTRIRAHSLNAEDRTNTLPVYNAIRKYRDDVFVDILAVGTEDVILGLENSLRPDTNIGWNVRVGGDVTVSSMMKEKWQEEDFRAAMVAERKNRYETNKECREAFQGGAYRFRKSKEGLNTFREHTQRQWDDPETRRVREAANKKAGQTKSQTYKQVGSWLSTRTKHHVWERADEIYDVFKQKEPISKRLLAEEVGLHENEVDNMHRKFKKGWVPLEDARWADFYKNGGRELYGK